MKPAEVFPPGSYIEEELKGRGWTARDLAWRMGGKTVEDIDVNECCIELLINAPDRRMRMGRDTAEQIGRAFGTGAEVWVNLDAAWRESA